MNGRYNVSYSDINALAFSVLRHRIKLTFEAIAERVSADEIIQMIIDELVAKNNIADEKGKKAAETAPVVEAAAEDTKTKKRGGFGRK
jgi:MoxR-like ATPase